MAVLYPSAHTRFCLIFRSVASEIRIAFTTSRGSSRISVTSAASIATSVPDPIAVPTDATARAGASLTPSPTIMTRRPPAWIASTASDLSSGSTSARTASGSMPTRFATA